jgi:hypothetical protein
VLEEKKDKYNLNYVSCYVLMPSEFCLEFSILNSTFECNKCINKAKEKPKKTYRAWGCSSLLEHMLSMNKALDWMPSTKKKNKNPGASVILTTWETEIGRISVGGYPWQKVWETLSQQKKLGVMVHACHPSYCRKCKFCPGKKQDPISKIANAKRLRGVAQVVEHLPSKHEASSSNPSTA